MPAKAELVVAGGSNLLGQLLGSDPVQTIASAGANQAAAAPLTGNFCIVTGAAGVVLPPAAGAGMTCVFSVGASTIYPAVGEVLNNLAANTGILLTAGRTIMLVPNANRWLAVGSAN